MNKVAPEVLQLNTLIQQGLALHQQGKLNQAQLIFEQALGIQANHFELLQLTGTIAVQTKCYERAIELFSKAILLSPKNGNAYYNLGVAHEALKQFDSAISSYDHAISFNPQFAQAYFNRGLIYDALKQFDAAICNYDQAIRLMPNYAETYLNRANASKAINRLDEALIHYDNAIKINPNYAEAYCNRGTVLQKMGRLDDALLSYDNAITIKPDFAGAYNNRGNTLKELGRLSEALASYDITITISSDYAEAYNNRGNALQELGRLDEALDSHDKAINIRPDFAAAYSNRGKDLQEMRRFEDALASFDRAIQLNPDIDYLLGSLIHTKMHLCNWDQCGDLIEQLTAKIIKNDSVTTPFIALTVIDDPKLQKQSAEIYINGKYPANQILPDIKKHSKHQKIRIGYFSADFREHPVAYLTAELFELHNRDQFEVFAFSFGINTEDYLRKRLEKAFDQFIDVRNQSDEEIALLARQMEIDIAVDLGGFTAGFRVGIFARKAAPIQVNYLGYPGTMGADFMDYIIADPTLIPQYKQQHYSEKIAYLPDTYMVNDSTCKPSEKSFTRAEFGLPENAVIFACFNASYKITPTTFSSWMRILDAVSNSVLWLSSMDQKAINNLKLSATKHGIEDNRIIFATRMNHVSDHLNRITLADLFLDTFPYNAHTTTNDALRVGLPVLTLMGESFASRVAASQLNAVELPELITTNSEAYESLAIEMGNHPEQLQRIKSKLVNNLASSVLNNPKTFARYIELLYGKMYQRYQQKLTPDHIYLDDSPST